jgi:hypothetical protein
MNAANSLLEQRSKIRIKELLMMAGAGDNGDELIFTNSAPNDSALVLMMGVLSTWKMKIGTLMGTVGS